MSHFSVMVIGDDVESQLAPFHEFECTGYVDQYVVDVDVTDEVRAESGEEKDLKKGLEYFGFEDSVVENLSEVDRNGDHKWGYAVVQNGELIQACKRTNPNKKWDWFVIGGRWNGFFLLTEAAALVAGTTHASQCLKRDIDIEGMRDAAAARAEADWKEVHAYLDAASAPHTWPTWAEAREAAGDDIEVARTAYRTHPSIQAIKDRWEVDQYLAPLEDFIQEARDKAFGSFATLHNGEWRGRGDMGWFAFVRNEDESWDRKFSEFFDSLPDDTQITIVDCHI